MTGGRRLLLYEVLLGDGALSRFGAGTGLAAG